MRLTDTQKRAILGNAFQEVARKDGKYWRATSCITVSKEDLDNLRTAEECEEFGERLYRDLPK